jgi:hypothetical protein
MNWIPTTEALPEVGQRVAVTGPIVELAVAIFNGSVFVVNGVGILPTDLTAWSPIEAA